MTQAREISKFNTRPRLLTQP